jgi:Secretion system C-terminal sorting domain
MKYIFLFISFVGFSQEVSRATISVVGNSNTTSGGYFISQSVGQLSTIGFAELFNKSIVQGYQQPTGVKILDVSKEQETLQLFPVPVSDELNILFSMSIEGNCTVELFDPLGRLVASKECAITDYKTSISLINLATSTYIVKITKNTITSYETIIKN